MYDHPGIMKTVERKKVPLQRLHFWRLFIFNVAPVWTIKMSDFLTSTSRSLTLWTNTHLEKKIIIHIFISCLSTAHWCIAIRYWVSLHGDISILWRSLISRYLEEKGPHVDYCGLQEMISSFNSVQWVIGQLPLDYLWVSSSLRSPHFLNFVLKTRRGSMDSTDLKSSSSPLHFRPKGEQMVWIDV